MRPRFGRKIFIVTMSILIAGVGALSAETHEPGPFDKLFRSIKHAFTEPQQKSPTHHSTHRQQAAQASPTSSPGVQTTTESTNNAPNEKNTRSATRASTKKGEDFPYGTPVPGKQGFVTSPFSPNSGYIDVRGFAPGTPVKDPYTGKVFLTP